MREYSQQPQTRNAFGEFDLPFHRFRMCMELKYTGNKITARSFEVRSSHATVILYQCSNLLFSAYGRSGMCRRENPGATTRPQSLTRPSEPRRPTRSLRYGIPLRFWTRGRREV